MAAACMPRVGVHSSVTLEMRMIGHVHESESGAPAPSEAAAVERSMTSHAEGHFTFRPIKRVVFAHTLKEDVHALAAQLCSVGSAPSLCSNCGFSTQSGRAQTASDAMTHAHDECACAKCDMS